tara:strand:+ start:183 stop:1049 length:867 start_codon:yes stop_codon:yes gene_type:complete
MPRGIPKKGYRNMNKNKNNLDLVAAQPLKQSNETDVQIDQKLKDRFDILEMMTNAAIDGSVKSLIVSGPAGLGKSYTVEQALEGWDPEEVNHTVIRGYVKATGLYKTLYQYRNKGQMIVFDDSDSIFMDDTTLAMLKAVCDSTERRRVSYLSEFNMIDEASADVIPRSFQFDGTIVFITNLDFDSIIEKGNKLAPHLSAMVSRSHYIDLAMKTRRDYFIRIKQVVDQGLLSSKGLDKKQEARVMYFIEKYQDSLREMSLRVAIKLADLIKTHPDRFEVMGKVTVCKGF